MEMTFIVPAEEQGKTAGEFLLHRGASRRLITKLKRVPSGITRNGSLCRTIDKVNEKDVIKIFMEDEKKLTPNGELFVPVLYESECAVVFDKPSLMPVHPSIKHQGDTLGNYFSFLYPTLTFRPVNRLDRDTSGCCVVAKTPFSAKALQFSVRKIYYAVVVGQCESEGTIDLPIARKESSIILREVSMSGQKAVTHYKRIYTDGRYSLVEIYLETGRTHQIRVHFSHIGYPLLGDGMYGEKSDIISRQALHCGRVEFVDPLSRETVICKSPLPKDMQAVLTLPSEI